LGQILSDGDKGSGFEPYYPATDRSFGGPDAFGHNWLDSDEPGGPVFEWIDITSVGTAIGLGDDSFAGPLSLGFSFPFYENSYSDVYVGSNGIITFGAGSSARSNLGIPNAVAPNNMIALWWDDLDPSDGGAIYYYTDMTNGYFVISFVGVPNYQSPDGTGSLTCQAILYPSGKMKLQYLTMDAGADANGLIGSSIGLENAGGSDGLEVVYNAAYMHDNLAINISALNWLSAFPGVGVVEPYSSLDVDVVFDATELEDGEYSGQIGFGCNDPNTPEHLVDATMTVTSGPLYICGDINNDGSGPDVADLTYLVDYLFAGGPVPGVMAATDVDGTGAVDVADLTYMVDYLFAGGAAPNCL
jgi:hypothetical protein